MTGLRASPAFVASMLLGFGLLTAPPAVADDTLRSDPRAVRIVTTDIPRFWAAYDAAQTAPDPAHVYAAQYFAPGTNGLKGFIPYRLQSPQHLADVVQRQKAFYAQARDATMRIAAARERIQADLVRYKQVVPDAVFPDIYFVQLARPRDAGCRAELDNARADALQSARRRREYPSRRGYRRRHG